MEDILSFEESPLISKFSFGWKAEFNATLSGIPYEITKADKEGQDRAASIRCTVVELLATKELTIRRSHVVDNKRAYYPNPSYE